MKRQDRMFRLIVDNKSESKRSKSSRQNTYQTHVTPLASSNPQLQVDVPVVLSAANISKQQPVVKLKPQATFISSNN